MYVLKINVEWMVYYFYKTRNYEFIIIHMITKFPQVNIRVLTLNHLFTLFIVKDYRSAMKHLIAKFTDLGSFMKKSVG